jgi:methyl-accepting chemotaxis protein
VTEPETARRDPALIRWIADRSVRAKLFTLTGIACVAVGLVCWVGFGALKQNVEAAHRLQQLTALTRVALAADQAHDAIRGDVLSALLAGDQAQIDAAQAELASHSTVMRDGVTTFQRTGIPSNVRAAADQAAPLIDTFLQQAATTIDGVEPGSRMAVPASFNRSFGEVEAALPGVADALESNAARAAVAVRSQERAANRGLLLAALTAGMLMLGLCWLAMRAILTPMAAVVRVCEGLATFDLTRTSGLDSKDEFGRMATLIDQGTGALRTMLANLGRTAAALSQASGELCLVSGELETGSRAAAHRAVEAMASASQVDASVQNIRSGADQMAMAVTEIASNAGMAAGVAQESVEIAEAADRQIAQLAQASGEIDGVVQLISSIAEQTNLLALNATIEAARAGEAGKGFAVVASEVKELAQETARATGDITAKISSIQAMSTGATDAVTRIREVIGQMNEYSITIAAAVEQQSVTTQEMNSSVGQAATGSSAVSHLVGAVSEVAGAASDSARASKAASADLARYSEQLGSLISRFSY